MGYGSYSAADWQKLKNSRKLSNGQSVGEVFKRTECNPKMDPKFIGTRECFDSEEHPNTTPIVVGLDVTASMGYLAVELATGALNELITKLYSTGAVEDPALMCAAYGDFQDKSPLQVTQFESDIRIAEQLLEIYFENRGSGEVVPTCLWEFLARHTNIDAIRKRNQKAEIRSGSLGATIERVIGDEIPGEVTRESLLKEAEASFHVFHIMIGGRNQANVELLPGHCMVLDGESISCLPEIIISTIQLQKGETQERVLVHWDELKRPVIGAALAQLSLQADADIQL